MRNTMKDVLGGLLFFLLLTINPVPRVMAIEAINSAQIIEATIDAVPQCGNWRIVGVCVWFVCTGYPPHCRIDTQAKVGHYIPDVVVSAYARSEENPWNDIQPWLDIYNLAFSPLRNAALGTFSDLIGGGTAYNDESENNDQTRMRFKYADAIGNPALNVLGFTDYSCISAATPLQPVFTSDSDVYAWRLNIPEFLYPQSLTPLWRDVAVDGSNNILETMTGARWGNVYPRQGFIHQQHDYKAAAVIAQRVGDVITRKGQPHIYQPITGSDRARRQRRWMPPALVEGDDDTGMWQMLVPTTDSRCTVFPEFNDARGSLVSDPYVNRLNPKGDYAWNLWRPYACCKRPRGADTLIFHTGSFP